MNVSVVVPVYNVENYIEACLESLAAQDYSNIEVLLVDDRGADRSIERARPFLSDPRFRLLEHQHNLGLSAARNTGIKAASGDLLAFVDSDDLVAPEFVSALVEARRRSGAPIVSLTHRTFVDGNEPLFPQCNPFSSQLIVRPAGDPERFRPPFFAWLKAIDRKFLAKQDIFFLDGELYEDHRFHWLLAASDADMAWLDCPLYFYRARALSITTDVATSAVRIDILRELLGALAEPCGKRAVDVGLSVILDAYVGLLAQVKNEDLRTVFDRLGRDIGELRSTYPSYRPRGVQHNLIWRLSSGGTVTRDLLRNLVILLRWQRSVNRNELRFPA